MNFAQLRDIITAAAMYRDAMDVDVLYGLTLTIQILLRMMMTQRQSGQKIGRPTETQKHPLQTTLYLFV